MKLKMQVKSNNLFSTPGDCLELLEREVDICHLLFEQKKNIFLQSLKQCVALCIVFVYNISTLGIKKIENCLKYFWRSLFFTTFINTDNNA